MAPLRLGKITALTAGCESRLDVQDHNVGTHRQRALEKRSGRLPGTKR
jgi:hypothetical protein